MRNCDPAIKGKLFAALAFFFIFLISFTIYYLTGEGGPTTYNNFVRLADAFLNGRLYLLEDIPWLELAEYNGKYYVIPPPMPAILMLPLVAIFGLSFNQALASIFLGSLNVSIAFLVARQITLNRSAQIWTTLMFGFGTIHWWLAATGWVWFISQVTSATFLLLAIYLTLRGKPAFFPGFLLGASYLSRITTVLSLPFFVFMLYDKWFNRSKTSSFIHRLNLRPLIYFGLGLGTWIIINSLYNYFRFDTFLDASYYLKPGIFNESIYQMGLFDITYIPRHLKIMFTRLPIFLSEPPYVMPSWEGLSIWITTPAFIYALFANIRNRLTIACWMAIIPVALVDFAHGGPGWAQFGYRYAFDFYPFLFILTLLGIGDRIRWHHKLLISLGILINLWGVLWINKFGWVRY